MENAVSECLARLALRALNSNVSQRSCNIESSNTLEASEGTRERVCDGRLRVFTNRHEDIAEYSFSTNPGYGTMTENVVVIKRAQREIRIPTLCNISASGQTLEKSTCRDRRKTRASYFDSIKSRVSETTALFFPFKTPTVTKKTKEEQKRYSLRGRKLQVMVF